MLIKLSERLLGLDCRYYVDENERWPFYNEFLILDTFLPSLKQRSAV